MPLLRHPAFVRFLYVRVAASIALQIQVVAVGWQMYDLTGSPFDLGLIGLVQFVPAISLFRAHRPRRGSLRPALGHFHCEIVEALAVAVLAFANAMGRLTPDLLLAMAFVVGTGRAFEQPSLQSVLPNIVPADLLPRAIAGSTSASQTAIVAGPALGGVLVEFSPTLVFTVCAALWLSAGLVMLGIAMERNIAARAPVDLKTLFSGVTFIARHKVVLGAVLLDLFAVLLGNATALLPIFARDIYLAGPLGFGVLRAAPAAGAIASALMLARWPISGRVGRIMFAAVTIFGAATIILALTPSFGLAMAALARRRRLRHGQRRDPPDHGAAAHARPDARPRLCGEFDGHDHVEPAWRFSRRRGGRVVRHHSLGADRRHQHHRDRPDFDQDFPRTLRRRPISRPAAVIP